MCVRSAYSLRLSIFEVIHLHARYVNFTFIQPKYLHADVDYGYLREHVQHRSKFRDHCGTVIVGIASSGFNIPRHPPFPGPPSRSLFLFGSSVSRS